MRSLFRSPSLVDGLFVFALGVVALLVFRDTFIGWGYLVAGTVGLVVGIGAVGLVERIRQPLLLGAVLVVVAYFVLGGVVALHGMGGGYLYPGPQAWRQLSTTAVHGWKELLTELPPLAGDHLLAVPYILGLVTGWTGAVLGARMRSPLAPMLAPLGLLVLVILLGAVSPTHTAVSAAAFAVLTLAWMVLRARRLRAWSLSNGSRSVSRRATAAVMCLGAAAVGLIGGGHLPGARADRVVLRSHVVPPFDVGQYPTPLAEFRRFTKGYAAYTRGGSALYNTALFRVTGVKAGTWMRLAALDSYDGAAWGAGNVAGTVVDDAAPGPSDTFQKVGSVIDSAATGRPVHATVTMLSDQLGVWLPTVGELTGVHFAEPDESAGASDFRYNIASGTGLLPQGVVAGDTYSFTAVQPSSALTVSTPVASGALPGVTGGSAFSGNATAMSGSAGSPLAELLADAAYLKQNGHLSDGDGADDTYTAGHSIKRLQFFLSTAGQMAGDDEQYAALMGIFANDLGLPARVVVGAQVPSGGVVKGSDMHAWIEIQATDGTWRMLPDTMFLSSKQPKKTQQRQQPTVAAQTVPPPAPVHPPQTAGEPLSNAINHRNAETKKHLLQVPGYVWAILKYAGSPILVIALICGAIIGLKTWRRSRRRRRGPPVRRLRLAWRELVDHARDFGHHAPVKATRREQAAALPLPGVSESARVADNAMFGPVEPTDADADEIWRHVDEVRHTISAGHGRWARFRAAINVSTLRLRGADAG